MTGYCDKECRDNAACSGACKDDEVSSSSSNALLSADDRAELERVLTACKTKLEIYRAHTDSTYKGGMEYTALIRLIEETSKRFCT